MSIEREMPPMPTKPAPFPEMRMLDVMVGTWTGTGEVVEPPMEGETFSGGSVATFELDGTVFRSDGWYELPGNQRGSFFEYWTWDPREGRFRTWFTSDWSETGTGWVTPSADGRCFQMEGRSVDAWGAKKKFNGFMCVLDNDTIEWQFTEKGPMGRMTMRGKSNRQR